MGEELGDHHCLGIGFDECNQMKKKTGTVAKFESTMHKGKTVWDWFEQEGCLAINNRLSYPNQLAQMLGLECDNRAMPGASQEKIYWDMVEDLRDGRIRETDIVLIGNTLPDRITTMQFENDHVQSTGINLLSDTISEQQKKMLLDIWPHDQFVWWFWNWLKLTKVFAEQHKLSLMIAPCTINDLFPKDPALSRVHPSISDYADKVWREIEPVVLGRKGLEDFSSDPDNLQFAGWGHFPAHNHAEFAKYLYQQLKLFGNLIGV